MMQHLQKATKDILTRYNLPGTVNWFPGHMAKTSQQLQKTLKKIDLVIEVRDARPLIATKRRVIVFNKAELADPSCNAKLTKLYTEKKKQQDNAPSVCFITLKNIHTRTHADIQQLVRLCFDTVHATSKSSFVSKTTEVSLSSSPSRNELTHKTTKDSLSKEQQQQRESTKTSKKKNEKEKHKTENENKNTNKIENSSQITSDESQTGNKKQLKPYPTTVPAQRKGFPETLWLVCGMPNVGKSTLINKLVGRYCAGVAAKPGWTRGHTIYRLMDVPPKTRQSNQQSANCLTTPLSTLGSLRPVDIDSYFIPKAAQQRTALLMDTPGLMVPRSEISLEMGLRLAVVGCVQPEHVFGGVVIVADYLLSCLYQFTALTDPSKEVEWKSVLHIPPALQHEVWPIERLLLHIQTTKKKQDEHSAAHYFLSLFQEGKLGRFTLDPVPDDPDSLL